MARTHVTHLETFDAPDTHCGPETYRPACGSLWALMTDRPEAVTCKRCLRMMQPREDYHLDPPTYEGEDVR